MNVDPSVMKRLTMESDANGVGTAEVAPVGVLVLTEGKGEDLLNTNSPTSSSSSKRARIGIDGVNVDGSAASREEDLREQ